MDAVLPLLPARGLDQSILLPVLVGMLVMLILTETLGWGFVGVVVPGYLASVLAIEPLTGIAIFTEALVTLALARGAASVLSRAEGWTEFFGRDRFFLIVFISVVVRQHDHTWLYPALASAFDGRFGTQVLMEQRFFSVGLVIVPLMANMFWKPDRLDGLIKISTIVLITWGILEFVLLPYTNLSFGSFELTYENAALDFLGNAKAYIILLEVALVVDRRAAVAQTAQAREHRLQDGNAYGELPRHHQRVADHPVAFPGDDVRLDAVHVAQQPEIVTNRHEAIPAHLLRAEVAFQVRALQAQDLLEVLVRGSRAEFVFAHLRLRHI